MRFSENDMAKIIQKRDPNRAYTHNQISIRMMKMFPKTICKPLECIFCECLNTDLFPLELNKQCGSKPGELCINQLICIIKHEIYESLDADLEVRRVFLYI